MVKGPPITSGTWSVHGAAYVVKNGKTIAYVGNATARRLRESIKTCFSRMYLEVRGTMTRQYARETAAGSNLCLSCEMCVTKILKKEHQEEFVEKRHTERRRGYGLRDLHDTMNDLVDGRMHRTCLDGRSNLWTRCRRSSSSSTAWSVRKSPSCVTCWNVTGRSMVIRGNQARSS